MRTLPVRLANGIDCLLRMVVGTLLGIMVVVVALQVVVRFALPPLGIIVAAPWTEELARYLLVWSIFLGAAIACRAGTLIAVDALPDALPPRWGRRVRVVAISITIAFLLQLTLVGWRYVSFGWSETSTVLGIPMAVVYLAMPIGSAIAAFNLAVVLLEGDVERLSGNDPDRAEADPA